MFLLYVGATQEPSEGPWDLTTSLVALTCFVTFDALFV